MGNIYVVSDIGPNYGDKRALKIFESLSKTYENVIWFCVRDKYPRHKNDNIIDLPNFGNFRLSEIIFFIIFPVYFYFIHKKVKGKIIIGYCHFGAINAYIISRIYGLKFIYDYPDPFKGWYYYKSKNDTFFWKLCRHVFYFIERHLYLSSDYTICASVAQLEFLRELHGYKKNADVIFNCPDLNLFNLENRDKNTIKKFKIKNRKILIHLGYIGEEYGADIILRTLNKLKNKGDIFLIFLGSFSSEDYRRYLKNLIEELKLGDKVYFDRVVYEKVPHYLNTADIGIICFRDRFYNHLGGPNKLFEYMSCGLGIVSAKMKGFEKMVIEKRNVIFAKPEDVEDFFNKILILLKNQKLLYKMRKNNIKLSRKVYNWEVQEEKLLNIIKKLK